MADTLVAISRAVLWRPALHFVDDFGAPEPLAITDSGLSAFTDLFEVLGLKSKTKKAQPPDIRQKILGALIETAETLLQVQLLLSADA